MLMVQKVVNYLLHYLFEVEVLFKHKYLGTYLSAYICCAFIDLKKVNATQESLEIHFSVTR